MGYIAVMTDVRTVGAGATTDIQPPVTQDWEVTQIGSDQWVGVPPNARPDVLVSYFDGVRQASMLRDTDERGWYRVQKFIVSNANYIRVTNQNAAQAQISFSAHLRLYTGAGASINRSDVQNVGAGAQVSIQPGVTEDWVIWDIGSDQWVGAGSAGLPNLTVELDDGVNQAQIMSPVNIRMWEPQLRLVVDNGDYVTITNNAGVAADIAWSAELLLYTGTGASINRSDVQVAGAGANVDFQPPAGQEWVVRMIGASVWVGIAPNAYPDVTVSIFDGVNASTIQNNANRQQNTHRFDIHISNTNYLRVNDSGGAGGNIGISAELLQMYA
jgi:hypothetical protein